MAFYQLIHQFIAEKMALNKHSIIFRYLKKFYNFSPKSQLLILSLMVLQGFTAGIGLLLIIPLLQVVGFDMGAGVNNSVINFITKTIERLDLGDSLIGILLCYIVIISGIASLKYKLTVLSVSIQQAYTSHLRNQLYRRLLKSEWQFVIKNKMSEFMHSLSVQVQAIGQASILIQNMLSQAILTIIMLVLVFLLSWKITLLSILFALGLLLILLPFNRLIFRSGQKQLISYKDIFQMLTEQLSSLKMIKSFASEDKHADQVQKVSIKLETQQTKFASMSALTQWVYMVGAVIGFSIFFYTAQIVLQISLTTTLLLLIIFSRLLPQIANLQKIYQQLLHKVPAFVDVENMLLKCQSAQESNPPDDRNITFQNSMTLENISYCYPNKTSPTLENLYLEIKKNETVAIVGPSGVGKTTLADIIAGLLTPQTGKFYCDNIAMREADLISWRQNVAYITQDVYLFHDTIRANLNWFSSKKISDDILWQTLELAAADEFVKRLPNSLDTIIGDRGIRLSGGERQRLVLARALLSKPQLLILDEATSALDYDNEKKIQQALKQLQGTLTIIIIAHRDTTICHADKVVTLNIPE